MRYLLDTHVVLFASGGPSKSLSKDARRILEGNHHRLLSQASLWEIAILISRGRFFPAGGFSKFTAGLIDNLELEILPISTEHLEEVSDLPFHHNDPFDRLLIAQSISENVKIVSRDEIFDEYDVTRVW